MNSFKEKKEKILGLLELHGWKENPRYRNVCGDHFRLSPDERYAITLKAQVFTIHDATRQYCKVLSVKYSEADVEIIPGYGVFLTAGKLYFKIL